VYATGFARLSRAGGCGRARQRWSDPAADRVGTRQHKGDTVTQRAFQQQPPLTRCSSTQQIITWLLSHNASVDLAEPRVGFTPLRLAAARGNGHTLVCSVHHTCALALEETRSTNHKLQRHLCLISSMSWFRSRCRLQVADPRRG
jgi:hypothetical protein